MTKRQKETENSTMISTSEDLQPLTCMPLTRSKVKLLHSQINDDNGNQHHLSKRALTSDTVDQEPLSGSNVIKRQRTATEAAVASPSPGHQEEKAIITSEEDNSLQPIDLNQQLDVPVYDSQESNENSGSKYSNTGGISSPPACSSPLVRRLSRRNSNSYDNRHDHYLNSPCEPPVIDDNASLDELQWHRAGGRDQQQEEEDDEEEGTHYSAFGWPTIDPLSAEDADGNDHEDLGGTVGGGEDNNEDDLHYSAFGWPDNLANDNDNDNDNDDFRNSSRLSMDDFYTGQDYTMHESSASFFSDRPLQRSLIKDFLNADDYQQDRDESMNTAAVMGSHVPTDEVDQFFSAGQVDSTSMSFSARLSIQQQRQQFLALAKATYITSWPHFLTLEYFDHHDAHDRADIVPSSPPSTSATSHTDPDREEVTTKPASAYTASYFDTKFSVIERLGVGEYAEVWKVFDIQSNEVFAVKKLKAPFNSFADRWLQLVEVRNMLMVQHSPYCLSLFNSWEQDGYLYLQTDFSVATLADYFQDQKEAIDESTAWNAIHEIATGLQAIHQAGIVHLDLKPSNIMIDANGTLKIGDFGTSLRLPLDQYEFKGEGDRQYMAPDLLREEYDTPADVFSLGLIIFEMMTKITLPDSGDSWEMLRLGDFSNYKQQLVTVPLEIRRVMLMMLEPSSKERATIDDILALPYLRRITAKKSNISSSADQQPGALGNYVQLLAA